ncbi:hypothetical protein CDO87_06750 [Sagittula sp. P11]|nr:hypothetical protein CDO87_06750 [Sagittula sp. P11]
MRCARDPGRRAAKTTIPVSRHGVAPEGIPGVRSSFRLSDADLTLDHAAPRLPKADSLPSSWCKIPRGAPQGRGQRPLPRTRKRRRTDTRHAAPVADPSGPYSAASRRGSTQPGRG